MTIEFVVPGKPVPQGSMRAFTRRGGGVGVTDNNEKKLRPWRAVVTMCAQQAGARPIPGALRIDIAFSLVRPKTHSRTGRNAHLLRDSAPRYPITNPDLDKLVRAILDALTSVCFADDAQVTQIVATKSYAAPGEPDETWIRVMALEKVEQREREEASAV